MKVGELFAGIGGIGLGFEKAGSSIVWANEQDAKAAVTYRANFPKTHFIESRMEEVDDATIASLPPIDVLTGGFPCQAFSVAGKREGFDDVRGNVFFDILRYLRILQPQAVFLENVKNLVSHDGGNTFTVIKAKLKAFGYHLTYKVMNTADYTDVPQNRERIYIIGFKNEAHAKAFKWPEPTHKVRGIRELLESNVDEAYFYDKSKYHAQLQAEMTNPDTLYQWRRVYARENKSNLCPTLTANMGTGGHNVPLVLDGGRIRKLTPRECVRFQGYPEDYKLLEDVLGKAALYKQIGNSVSVPVVELLAKEMMRVLSGGRNDVLSEPK